MSVERVVFVVVELVYSSWADFGTGVVVKAWDWVVVVVAFQEVAVVVGCKKGLLEEGDKHWKDLGVVVVVLMENHEEELVVVAVDCCSSLVEAWLEEVVPICQRTIQEVAEPAIVEEESLWWMQLDQVDLVEEERVEVLSSRKTVPLVASPAVVMMMIVRNQKVILQQ